MLETNELANIRADIEDTFDNTCTILRPTISFTASRAVTTTWGTVATNVACTLRKSQGQIAGTRAIAGDKIIEQATYYLSLPYDQDIKVSDRVVINNTTYDVRTINADDATRGCLRAVIDEAETE